MTDLIDRQKLGYIAAQAADARLNVELETEGMTLNIGPQHPATHGTLRIIVRLDGEQVVWADPSAGYMHRGYEKLVEVRTYPQVTTLINRIDWLGSFANEVPFILAAEQLMEIEAPPRAQWIRTILFELSRISNIVLFLGDMAVQLGALTPVARPNWLGTVALTRRKLLSHELIWPDGVALPAEQGSNIPAQRLYSPSMLSQRT